MVTRNVANAQLNQVLYMGWCDARGKVIDDGTISRLDEQTYRLTSAEPNLRWLHRNAFGMQVVIEEARSHSARSRCRVRFRAPC